MPMLAMMEFAEKIKNNFIKAIQLLRLKFTPTPKNRLWGFAKNLSLHRKKYLAVFCTVLILIGIGLIIPQGFAHAMFESVGSWIMNNLIYRLVYFIFWVLFFIAYAIAYLGAYILDLNLNPLMITTVLNSPMVTQSWAIFRDIANLFFILILLFIAIGTIVRSQSYNLKNLLPKLIIAVFLINFSAVIAKLIIDFGNIFMYGVLKWMNCPGKEECFRDFFPNLMGAVDGFWDKYGIGKVLSPSTQDVVGLVIATFYAFIYGLILIALGTFLLIRIAAFAILIILSPLLAFTGEVFPGLQELSSKWWKNLVNYTLFGPIFALLLYVSGLMAQIQITVPTIGNVNTEALGTFGNIYATVIQYAIPLIFLLAIIPITQELGIAGANAVLGSTVLAGGAFLAGAASFAGGAIDRYMARGAQKGHGTARKLLSYASPGAWKRALKAHSAEAEHDYDVATGQQRAHIIERVTDWPNKKGLAKSAVDKKKEAEDREVSRKMKDLSTENVGELSNIFADAVKNRDYIMAEAVFRKLSLSGDTDAALEVMGLEKSRKGFSELMNKYFKGAIGEERSAVLSSDVANAEEKNGNISFAEMGYYNKKDKKWQLRDISVGGSSDEVDQRKEAVKKFKVKSAHEKFRGLSALSMTSTDTAGNIEMTNAGLEMISTIKGEDWNHVKKMKRNQAEKLQKALRNYQAAGLMVAGTAEEAFLNKLDAEFGV